MMQARFQCLFDEQISRLRKLVESGGHMEIDQQYQYLSGLINGLYAADALNDVEWASWCALLDEARWPDYVKPAPKG